MTERQADIYSIVLGNTVDNMKIEIVLQKIKNVF